MKKQTDCNWIFKLQYFVVSSHSKHVINKPYKQLKFAIKKKKSKT
jgi:hypothetical protein